MAEKKNISTTNTSSKSDLFKPNSPDTSEKSTLFKNEDCNNTDESSPVRIYGKTDQSHTNQQQSDHYCMILDFPKCLKKLNATSERECDLLCLDSITYSLFSVNLPSISVPAKNIPYLNGSYKISSRNRVDTEPLTISFKVNNRLDNYWIVYKWLDLISDDKNSTSRLRDSDYTTTLTVALLDEYRNANVGEFSFFDAFPTNISDLPLSDQGGDDLQVSVTFEYSHMKVDLL